MTHGPDQHHAAWDQILGELEDDLRRGEVALETGAEIPAGTWAPPERTAPIPDDLLPRARDLLARQERLMADLAVAQRETLSLLRAASPRAGATHVPVRAAYLDLQA